jgi:hypothetical protein
MVSIPWEERVTGRTSKAIYANRRRISDKFT